MKFKLLESRKTVSSSITNSRILNILNGCFNLVQGLGYNLSKLKVVQVRASTYLGRFIFPETPTSTPILELNEYTYDAPDEELMSTIYHELAHYLQFTELVKSGVIYFQDGIWKANTLFYQPHGYSWKKYASKFAMYSGTDADSVTGHSKSLEQANQKNAKYVFQCATCGSKIFYQRNCKFVQTYDKQTSSGKYIWTCTNCGGHFERVR